MVTSLPPEVSDAATNYLRRNPQVRVSHPPSLPHSLPRPLRARARASPSIDATRIDKLDDDAPFFVCDRQGQWYGIVYLPDGTLGEPGQCGLENSVGAPQPYSGACLTGWVSSRYVDASGTQDSDEPYVEEGDDAGGPRVVQVSASGPSQVIAVTRLSAKAESEYDKPVGQRPDGNRVSCRETGTGDAAWTCSATYTLTN